MRELSHLVLPVTVSREAIAEAAAAAAPRTLAAQDDFLGRGLRLRVERVGDADVAVRDAVPPASDVVVVGLRLTAAVGVSRRSRLFGETSAGGTLELEVSVRLALVGWELLPQTRVVAHRWIDRPELRVGGFEVGVGALTSLILEAAAGRIERRIDDDLRARRPLSTAIAALKRRASEPIALDPRVGASVEVGLARLGVGKLHAPAGGLKATIALGFAPTVVLAAGPSASAEGDSATARGAAGSLPNAGVPDGAPSFSIAVRVRAGFGALGRAATEALAGRSFGRFGRTAVVASVRMSHVEGDLQVDVAVRGDVDAEVRLRARPSVDAPRGCLRLERTSVEVLRGGLLARGAGRLLAGRIARAIERRIAEDAERALAAARRQLDDRLRGGEVAPGVAVEGSLAEFAVRELSVGEGGVSAEAYLAGAAEVRLARLPPPPRAGPPA